MSKSLYVMIPDDLYQKLHQLSFEKGISKKQIIIDAIEKHLGIGSVKSIKLTEKLKDKIFEKPKEKGDIPFS